MFGAYRTLLALMVVLQHLGGMRGMGVYAVFGFFTLSGYLMTLILHETYGYSRRGLLRYLLNRFLRIYPVYWFACLVSLALIFVAGAESAERFHPALTVPVEPVAILRNLFIVLDFGIAPRLTPPAWALTIELFFYLCIGLGASRRRDITTLWLVASIGYTVGVYLSDLGWRHRYFSLLPASLPFATGAWLYHQRAAFARRAFFRFPWTPLLLFLLVLANYALAYREGWIRGLPFYLNYALTALLVISLSFGGLLPGLPRSWDRWLGELSYPIYLVHLQAGLLLMTLGVELGRKQLELALLSIPLVLLLAWAMVRLLARPLDALRARVRAL